jgi:hypothetical protein
MYIENQMLEQPINFIYISQDHSVLPIFQNNNLNTITLFLLYLIIFFI